MSSVEVANSTPHLSVTLHTVAITEWWLCSSMAVDELTYTLTSVRTIESIETGSAMQRSATDREPLVQLI